MYVALSATGKPEEWSSLITEDLDHHIAILHERFKDPELLSVSPRKGVAVAGYSPAP
jgi:hypothetical protein